VAGAFAVSCTFLRDGDGCTDFVWNLYARQSVYVPAGGERRLRQPALSVFANKSNLGPMTNFAGTVSFRSGHGHLFVHWHERLYDALFEKFSDGSKKGYQAKNQKQTLPTADPSIRTRPSRSRGDTYNVAYGHIDGMGVADSLVGVWQTPNGCMFQISLQLQ